MESSCYECQRTEPEVQLTMCRVCHKRFCEEHAVEKNGASFCSLGCSHYFFHVDEDDMDA